MNKNLVWIGVLVLIVVGVISFSSGDKAKVSSVVPGGEYQSVTIATGLQGTSQLLCTGAATLGSIVITGAAAGYLEVYDASTSQATLRTPQATTSLRKIASIPASAAANTYTFDANSYLGLLWEVTGAKATTTLTYRCYN